MSRNYLAASEQWKQEQVALARAILAGNIKFTTESQAFYEDWARKSLSHHGIATPPEEVPEANGKNHQAKGEATANDLPAHDERQGSLF